MVNIVKGIVYYGVVDIFGSFYLIGYELMKNVVG